jgi:hypothetical protein
LVLSLLYLLFRRVLAVGALRLRSREFKELEIAVLRHELAVLRRQVARPRLDKRPGVPGCSQPAAEQGEPAIVLHSSGHAAWLASPACAETVDVRRTATGSACDLRRDSCAGDRLAQENPRWGYQRIVGELAGVGERVSATTVAKILRQADMSPAGARAQLSWHEFLRTHAASIIACDFFTVETPWLGRLYVLFFIELRTRRVHLAGCSANPDGLWNTASAAARLVTRGTPDPDSVPNPRPRQQIQPRLRRGIQERAHRDHPHTVSRAEREGVRRALGWHHPPRLPRLAPNRKPQTARTQEGNIRRCSQSPPPATARPEARSWKPSGNHLAKPETIWYSRARVNQKQVTKPPRCGANRTGILKPLTHGSASGHSPAATRLGTQESSDKASARPGLPSLSGRRHPRFLSYRPALFRIWRESCS